MNITRYVEPVFEDETISLDKALSDLKEAVKASFAAEERLKELLINEEILR